MRSGYPARKSRLAGVPAFAVLIAAVPAVWSRSWAPAEEGGTEPPAISVGGEAIVMAGGLGGNVRATPCLAFGKDVFLVAWREGWHGKGGKARVYAARLDLEGRVLDPKGIEVAPCGEGVQEMPRAAFGGGAFLVVWQDLRNGKDFDVLGARISPEGKVLDSEPVKIAAAPRTQALPDVASDGEEFLVAWQGLEGDSPLYSGFAAPVSADGKVGPAVRTGASPQVRIAWGGGAYLAAYGASATDCVLLGKDGKPVGKSAMAIRSTKEAAFSLSAAPGAGWLIVGHRSPPDPWGWGGPGAMRCSFVTIEGKVENPTLQEPSGNWKKLENWLDVNDGRKTWPWGESAGAWDGKRFVAVWPRHHIVGETRSNFANCDLFAGRVERWKPLDPAGIPVAATEAEERQPSLASNGAGTLLCVYEKSEKGATAIAARLLRTR
ncbi:MAG: hypothetical protein N3A38_05175 [Planctomycetota bacterium]|nr:hypothetical protein [Planctomycetota bacterium]